MLLALYVAAVVNLVVAYLVSRSHQAHTTLVTLFSASLLSDLVQHLAGPTLRAAPTPYTGTARALFHLTEACVIAWPVGLSAAALAVFFLRSEAAVLLGGKLLVVALVIGYPVPFRGHGLGLVYAAVSASAFILGAAGAVASMFRRRKATVTETVLVGAVCAEGLTLAGPHLGDVFRDWNLAQLGYGVFYVAATLIQLEALWGNWKRSRPVNTR